MRINTIMGAGPDLGAQYVLFVEGRDGGASSPATAVGQPQPGHEHAKGQETAEK